MDVRVGLWRKLSAKELMLLTVVLEKTLESPLDYKEIQPVHSKGDQSWVFIGGTDVKSWNSNTLATWCEELTHWKRAWCWEGLRAGGKVGDRGWDGWMASLTRWTWVWVNLGSWWWTGRPGVLWFLGVTKSQTQLSDWTELNMNVGNSVSWRWFCGLMGLYYMIWPSFPDIFKYNIQDLRCLFLSWFHLYRGFETT